MKTFRIIALVFMTLFTINSSLFSQKKVPIFHDKNKKTVTISDSTGKLVMRLNYSDGCVLDQIIVNGSEVTGKGNIVFSGIRSGDSLYSSRQCIGVPEVSINNNTVIVNKIKYGSYEFALEEEWKFKTSGNKIDWQIMRQYLNDGTIDENCFPCWQFNSMETWDGAMLDNGGVAWNRFLEEPGFTYGANTSAIVFWKRNENRCLKILSEDNSKVFRSATFAHLKNDVFSVIQSSSAEPLNTRYGLRRFLTTGGSVFAPVAISKSAINSHFILQAADYNQEYDRGQLTGIKEEPVNEMLNTIGRYGVVDKNLYGSNGWRTGFAVLQEPWLALSGIAINSPDFINGFTHTLEYEKEHAIMADGRVLPRWHHDSTDAMPNTFRSNGFYECQWGYMFDSQPAFAINVAEQFDMTGDIEWIRNFKPTCEKVLDFMIKRDLDGNGLFEVVQKTYKEQRGTDWLDVVWASYEVASINAYMYKALIRWSELEKLLGDINMSEKYKKLALKLKTTFNKDIADGGFWNPDKKWYVHWREKDGSFYGNNFVCMVNFLSIGYGLCDAGDRKDAILGNIEKLMQKEKLFIWPSCFFPYEDNVGLSNVNYPYPNYENGDMFLAWAELGTRCYAEKNPETALKYIRNVINRYESDGLAHQRYSRIAQKGEGEDILSNNIMAVVGLYRNIYGIRPQYNRLYLEPHLTSELNGTQIKFWLRDQNYLIGLSEGKYSIGIKNYSVSNKHPFGINTSGNELEYFNANDDKISLKVSSNQSYSLDILEWKNNYMSWRETGRGLKNSVHHELYNLKAGSVFQLMIDDIPGKKITADKNGTLGFDLPVGSETIKVQMISKN